MNVTKVVGLGVLTAAGAMLLAGGVAGAQSNVMTWQLVNPEGVVAIEPVNIAERIDTLEGKTVGLKWNGKPNGNLFLDRIAELLEENVEGVNIIKFYEVEPSTVPQSAGDADAERKADIIARYHPDIVIGSQCD
ncbi:hypothetical protein LIP_0356 [Limnochorda pilosa]|nr:hypothetical protein [Limnochorda pilosa]BAS26213.1 hypothetical protein LIP_0356 [Limnochorda pilosa]